MMEQKDLFGNKTVFSEPRISTKEKEILRVCPLCGRLLTAYERNGHQFYECEYDKEFCEHMANVTDRDITSFQCISCDDNAQDCNCYDCMMIMCAYCNETINNECSKVQEFAMHNEDKIARKCSSLSEKTSEKP